MKIIIVCFGFFLLLSGCAPKTIVINVPEKPKVPSSDISMDLMRAQDIKTDAQFNAPVTLNLNLIPENGIDEKTIDNVSVKVESIVDIVNEADFTSTIDGPDGKQYTYSIFPMVLILNIENNTDHIIRLERTIILIEDDQKNEYKLVSDFGKSKQDLLDDLVKSFDEYRDNLLTKFNTEEVKEKHIDNYSIAVFDDYKPKYNQMVALIKDAEAKRRPIRTPDMEQNMIKTEYGIQQLYSENSPNSIFESGKSLILNQISAFESNYFLQNNNKRNEIEEKKKLAIEKIKDIDVNNLSYNFITSGVYLPISILPGRSVKIYAPITKRISGDLVEKVIVGVYDLPTKVDIAGNTTKRASFVFTFDAERI